MQDEIKRKLIELEKRIIVLEGGEIKQVKKEKPKPVEKPKIKPQIGTTTNPFEVPSSPTAIIDKPKEKKKVTTTENIVSIEQENDQSPLISKEEAEVIVETEKTEDESKPLDIDPLDIHLKEETLKEKYGNRFDEAMKALKEMQE